MKPAYDLGYTYLLNVNQNSKTTKGAAYGHLTGVQYFAPAGESGCQVCPFRSPACEAGCLKTTGRMPMQSVRRAQIARTRAFFYHREQWTAQLTFEIDRLVRKATKLGKVPSVRLNGMSDLPFERIPLTIRGQRFANIMSAYPAVQFYDYTKIPGRRDLPTNYHLTFSLSETNSADAQREASQGRSVAVVFSTPDFPQTYLGRPVINGDAHDIRYLDAPGSIVGLKAKGDARKDYSGWVIDTATLQPRTALLQIAS